MDTQTAVKENTSFIAPRLPEEVLLKLPKYVPEPTKYNLATQYYFWNRELIKENRELKKGKEKLEQELEKAKEKIAELEKEKEELKLQRDKFLKMIFKPKRKRDISLKKTEEKKPRTKQSYLRPLPVNIDERKETILKQCPYCQTKLSKRIDSYQRIIEDIPSAKEQKAKVINYTINRYWCKSCKKIVRVKPREALPKSRLGINTLSYVLYAKYRQRLPQNLIREHLQTYFNLKVSEGELNNLLNKGQQVFNSKWQEIIELVKNSKAVNADETGWKINGENHWLWAFTTDKAIRYTISRSRGKGLPQEVLGKNYQGTVISDFYPAYNQFKRKQRCWVHLLRKAKELVQQEPTKQRKQINIKLNRIYQEILFFRSQPETAQKHRAEKAEQIKEKLFSISRIKTGDHNLQKILRLCGKHSGELTSCILNPSIPPDNNSAERALRGAVIARKISGGSRSNRGALTYETNLSVIETLRKQQKQLFPAMEELIRDYITSNQ